MTDVPIPEDVAIGYVKQALFTVIIIPNGLGHKEMFCVLFPIILFRCGCKRIIFSFLKPTECWEI